MKADRGVRLVLTLLRFFSEQTKNMDKADASATTDSVSGLLFQNTRPKLLLFITKNQNG